MARDVKYGTVTTENGNIPADEPGAVEAVATDKCRACGKAKQHPADKTDDETFDTIVHVKNYSARFEQGGGEACSSLRLGDLCPVCREVLEGHILRAIRAFVSSWPLAIVVGCFAVALCVGCSNNRTDSALVGIVECMTGPAQETVEACEWVDVNNDGHVDLIDFFWLQTLWKCAIPEGCGLGTVPSR